MVIRMYTLPKSNIMRTNNNNLDRFIKTQKPFLEMLIGWMIVFVLFIIIGSICGGCSIYLGKGCTIETKVFNNDKIESCIKCDSTSYYFRQQKRKEGSLP